MDNIVVLFATKYWNLIAITEHAIAMLDNQN